MTTKNDAPPALVLLDFDGTLTERDGDFLVAEALLGPSRRQEWAALAQEYEQLALGTRGYFQRWLALLSRPRLAQAIAEAGAGICLREGAATLVDACRRSGLLVKIASEGLEAYIRPALERAGLGAVDLSCNRLVEGPGGLEVLSALDAEPCDRCLSCKAAHARRCRVAGRRLIVVGDGASDLCAARLADFVYARGSLAAHCEREAIAFQRWACLQEVAESILILMSVQVETINPRPCGQAT